MAVRCALPASAARSAVGGALLACACLGCESDKPFTPFGVVDAASPPRASAAPEPTSSSRSSAAQAVAPARRAILAPPHATRWTFDGRELRAPPGFEFERAVGVGGDVVALLVPSTQPPSAGPALFLYPTSGSPKRLAPLRDGLPASAGCTPLHELSATGSTSITWDVTRRCATPPPARTTERLIEVLSTRRAAPSLLALKLAAPAPGTTLDLVVDGSDRDGDGRDDVRLEFALGLRGSKLGERLVFSWFDRASGLARDDAEPAQSLGRSAAAAIGRARGASTRAAALEQVGLVRRAAAWGCAELGVARVFESDGSTLSCAGLSRVLEQASLAEFEAAFAERDAREIAALFGRDGWFGKLPTAERTRLETRWRALLTIVPSSATELAVRALPRGAEPRWSPLHFDADALLVQTPNGVVRVPKDARAPASTGEAGAPEAWPLEVRSAGGERWIGVHLDCATDELGLRIAARDGNARPPVPTRLLAPRPGPCAGPATKLVASPIAWGPSGLEALVAGSRLGASEAAPPRGSPKRSTRLVTASPLGLLVTGGAQPELFTPNGVDPGTLSECVIDADGERLACLRGDAVWRVE